MNIHISDPVLYVGGTIAAFFVLRFIWQMFMAFVVIRALRG